MEAHTEANFLIQWWLKINGFELLMLWFGNWIKKAWLGQWSHAYLILHFYIACRLVKYVYKSAFITLIFEVCESIDSWEQLVKG